MDLIINSICVDLCAFIRFTFNNLNIGLVSHRDRMNYINLYSYITPSVLRVELLTIVVWAVLFILPLSYLGPSW